MSKPSVAVRISGKEYRIKSDVDEASLQRVARYVDETMDRIRKRTGAVDSVEVALLTALNVARELDDARAAGEVASPPTALRGLIDRVEAVVASSSASPTRN
jgi:cell division protein ZapA